MSTTEAADAFCDSHCSWLDHHPDCTIPVGYLGVNKLGEIGKFRTESFSGAMPLYAHPPKQDDLRDALLEALLLALPFVEDANDDPLYKQGAASKVLAKIRSAIAQDRFGKLDTRNTLHKPNTEEE